MNILAPTSKKRVFDNFKDLLQREVANTPLGMIWMPAPRVALGREAGWLCRNVLWQPVAGRGIQSWSSLLQVPFAMPRYL